jgi:hypothetical protein
MQLLKLKMTVFYVTFFFWFTDGLDCIRRQETKISAHLVFSLDQLDCFARFMDACVLLDTSCFLSDCFENGELENRSESFLLPFNEFLSLFIADDLSDISR